MNQSKSNPANGLRALIDELYALASKKVAGAIASITGSFPIVIMGTPGSPNITIAPATDLSAGSLSAADKAKLDALAPGDVTAVTGVAPITSTGGSTPAISINPATDVASGSLSAADKAKLDGIAAGAGLTPTLVYQPGGVARANVYTTWSTLYAALNAVAPVSTNGFRAPTTIQVDDSFVTPAVVPAGAYNLDSVTLNAVASFNYNQGGGFLSLSAGVTLSFGNLCLADGIQVVYLGTTPCVTVSGPAQECNLFTLRGVYLACAAAGAFMAVTNGFSFVRANLGTIIGDGTHAVFTCAAPGSIQIELYGSAQINAAATTGAGTIVDWDCIVPGAQGAGVLVVQDVGYVPGVPGNWAGAPPTKVNQALDRIAANTTNAHPIP